MMRGTDETSGSLFSYVDLEDRIPAKHPLRKIRQVVNDALASLDADFEGLYVRFGRPSIAPERLIRASLLQILFSIRSERQLMEQMNYNPVFVKGVVTIPSIQAARSAGPSMGAPPPALWGSASSPPWPLHPVSGRSGFSQTEPIGVHCRVFPDQRSGCAARAAS